jgi:hypothetical protein
MVLTVLAFSPKLIDWDEKESSIGF